MKGHLDPTLTWSLRANVISAWFRGTTTWRCINRISIKILSRKTKTKVHTEG